MVRAGAASLVLAHPRNAGRLAELAATADAVVPRVRATVGGRLPRRVAVIVPDDEREMAALVGEKLVLGTIAAVAVADTVDTERDRALGQRIVINPANIDRLGQLGRRVVLEHEVTHLATRGFTGAADADLAGRRAGRLGRVPGQRAAGPPGRRPAARGARHRRTGRAGCRRRPTSRASRRGWRWRTRRPGAPAG